MDTILGQPGDTGRKIKNVNQKLTIDEYNMKDDYKECKAMNKQFILSCMAIGILAGGFHNEAFAMNKTEQTVGNQHIQKRELTGKDADRLIKEMKARGSTELVIPGDYTSIGLHVFDGYMKLGPRPIPINANIKSFYDDAVSWCEGVTSIIIPDSVIKIESGAFSNCSKVLRVITIPDSVISIGERAFAGLKDTRLIVPRACMAKYLRLVFGISNIDIVDENAKTVNDWKWPENGDVMIPYGVESIDDFIFEFREDIKFITIPDSIKYIGCGAFYGCSGLKSIKIPGAVEYIDDRAFEECSGLLYVTIPDSVQSIGMDAFCGCDALENIFIKCSDGVISSEKAAKIKEMVRGGSGNPDNVRFINANGEEIQPTDE